MEILLELHMPHLPDIQSSFILNARACSKIRDGLLLSGKVDYGWFGITVSRKLNQKNGFNIEIRSVLSESKLQEGDLIIKIGNKEIFNRGDIVDATFYARPGTFVEFLVLRNGKELTVPVRVSRRPPSVPDKISTKNTSLKAQSLNPSIESTKSLESKKTE
jgi:S1-C subfamily serine protease